MLKKNPRHRGCGEIPRGLLILHTPYEHRVRVSSGFCLGLALRPAAQRGLTQREHHRQLPTLAQYKIAVNEHGENQRRQEYMEHDFFKRLPIHAAQRRRAPTTCRRPSATQSARRRSGWLRKRAWVGGKERKIKYSNPSFRLGRRNPDATDGNLASARKPAKDSGLRLPPEWQVGAPRQNSGGDSRHSGLDPESRVFNCPGAESTKDSGLRLSPEWQ